jgi:hypothetical protein
MKPLNPNFRSFLFVAVLLLGLANTVRAQAEDGWSFKAGADERFRFEHRTDFDFNEYADDNGGFFFNRLRLSGKASLRDEIEVFVEALDAQVGSYQTKSILGQKDELDFFQGYVRLNDILNSRVDIKLGRQSLDFGKGRLIGAPTWSNRVRSFDAALAHFDSEGLYGDVFYGQTVNYDDHNFNKSREDEKLIGIYGGHQKDKDSPLVEGYFFDLIDYRSSTKIKRYTVGLRHKGKVGDLFEFDMEAPYQFGEQGSLDISAYAFHIDLAKKVDDWLWEPKFVVEYNQASGDKDPNDDENNSFTPLYQSTHTANGIMDFLRWQNLREAAFSAQLTLNKKIKLTPQLNFFWLEDNSDSFYNTSGTAVRTKTTGDRDHYLGNEASLVANYDVNKYLKLEAGAAHFFAGGFLADTGANDDANFVYSQVSVKY